MKEGPSTSILVHRVSSPYLFFPRGEGIAHVGWVDPDNSAPKITKLWIRFWPSMERHYIVMNTFYFASQDMWKPTILLFPLSVSGFKHIGLSTSVCLQQASSGKNSTNCSPVWFGMRGSGKPPSFMWLFDKWTWSWLHHLSLQTCSFKLKSRSRIWVRQLTPRLLSPTFFSNALQWGILYFPRH